MQERAAQAGRAEVAAGGEVSASGLGLRFGSAPGANRGGGSFAGSGGFPPYTFSQACPLDDARGNLTLAYVRLANAIDELRRSRGP